MKLQGFTIKTIVSAEGMLLTQSGDVLPEERVFSSKVYDDNLSNWAEWTNEEVENFIQEHKEEVLF